MTKPVDQLTPEEYAAERAEIARERAELAKQKAALTNGNGTVLRAFSDDDLFNAPTHIVDVQEQRDTEGNVLGMVMVEDIKPVPWPHEVKTLDDGHVLEYRKPDSSALIAISMVGMDGFDATQQMHIFNKFMAKHLSMSGLSYVLGRMADPDDEFGLGELITVLTADE